MPKIKFYFNEELTIATIIENAKDVLDTFYKLKLGVIYV